MTRCVTGALHNGQPIWFGIVRRRHVEWSLNGIFETISKQIGIDPHFAIFLYGCDVLRATLVLHNMSLKNKPEPLEALIKEAGMIQQPHTCNEIWIDGMAGLVEKL